LDKVQFPFRLMVIVEFAVVTAVALAALGNIRRREFYAFSVALIALASGTSMAGSVGFGNVAFSWKEQLPKPEDAPEYQPAGYPHPIRQGGFFYVNLEPVADVQPINCAPAVQACSIQQDDRFGDLRLHIESAHETTVTLRRYFFPAWRVQMLPSHQ